MSSAHRPLVPLLLVLPLLPLPGRANCPGDDPDGDGVVGAVDRCPSRSGPLANLGCPERDEDGDGIVDRLDRCPSVRGAPAAMGCPVEAPASSEAEQAPSPAPSPLTAVDTPPVRLLGWRFVFDEPISFLPGSAWLTERSEARVLALARLLTERPELSRILIEGHVDDPALSRASAQALSRERAEAVRKRLVREGIERGRLRTRGFGARRPLDASGGPEARERNNRVEVLVDVLLVGPETHRRGPPWP